MSSSPLHLIHTKLGIPESYASSCGLASHEDCVDLVPTELDVFGRQPYLERNANVAWQRMRQAAATDGVQLQLISAFRSVQYQAELFERKLARGDAIERILTVNAAPGFSEHHSGRALDIGTPGVAYLEEEFEGSAAFAWLQMHAHQFGFRLSFPRGNSHGVMYEPWHWFYAGTANEPIAHDNYS